MKTYALCGHKLISYDNTATPLQTCSVSYNALLKAFGMGPFNHDEAIGVLCYIRHDSSRERAEDDISDLLDTEKLELIEL